MHGEVVSKIYFTSNPSTNTALLLLLTASIMLLKRFENLVLVSLKVQLSTFKRFIFFNMVDRNVLSF